MSRPETASSPPEPRRRWLRWLKLSCLTGAGLLVLLIAFHRPLLHWAIRWGAQKYASANGLVFSGRVAGSLFSHLTLETWSLTPAADSPPAGPVRQLSWSTFALDYDLWALRRTGPGTVLQRLVLHDAVAEVDLRVPPDQQKPPKPEDPSKSPATLPRVSLPELDIRNLQAHVMLDDNEIHVRGLTLTWQENAPGSFQLDELRIAASGLTFKDLEGTTEKRGDTLVLRDVRLPHSTRLERLRLDVAQLHEGLVPLELEIARDAFHAGLRAEVGGLPDSPSVTATLGASGFTPGTLAGWVALPGTLQWDPVSLKLELAGPVLTPRALTGSLELTAGSVTAQPVQLTRALLRLDLAEGQAAVHDTEILAGANRVNLAATAPLPETWAGFAKLTADAELTLDAPAVQEVFLQEPPVSGRLTGAINATLTEGQPGPFTARLTATELHVAGRTLARVEGNARGTLQQLEVTSLTARLDDLNVFQAHGSMGWEDAQPFSVQWSLDFQNIAAALPDGPQSGHLQGEGTVSGLLQELTAQNFTHLKAHLGLQLRDLAWQQGRLQQAVIVADVTEGRARVQQADVQLDDKNQLSLSAEADLGAPHRFTARVRGDLPEVPRLSGWMQLANAPALESGRVALHWEGQGQWKDFALEGGGQLRVDDVKLTGQEHRIAAQLTTTHTGQRAELSQLTFSWGALRLEAQGSASPAEISLPRLSLSQDRQLLVQGEASIPLYRPPPAEDGFAAPPPQPPVPLDPARPLHVDLKLDQLDTTRLFALAGQKPPVSGLFQARLQVSGAWPHPELSLQARATGLQAAALEKKLAPADVDLAVTLKENRLAVEATATQPPLRPLRLSATMPANLEKAVENPQTLLDAPLQASLSLPKSDLAFLTKLVPTLARLSGQAEIDLKASGPLKAPHTTGSVRLTVPEAAFTQANLPEVRDAAVHLDFNDRDLRFTRVGAMLAGGRVALEGGGNWREPSNPAFDVRLRAEDALLMRDETLSLRTDLDITCRGTLQQAAVIGRIDLVRGRVFKEVEFLPLSLPNQLPPPPPPAHAGSAAPPAAPAPFDQWRLDLAIRTRDQIRLLGNVMNGGVAADLRLHGTGAQPILEGKATLEQVRLRLPFSRLTINRGDITFTKDRPFEPVLDISGDSYVNGYWVNLQAYGSAFDPKIRFSSSPPLPEGEIATLLATGATTGDLAGSEGEAANRAAFLLISQAYRKLFRKSGLPPKYDEEAPKLSFNFSVLDSGSSKRGVTAVYELSPKWQATGTVSARGTFRGLLYYLVRFR